MVLAHDISVGKRSQDIQITEDVTFDVMLLNFKTLQGLKHSGFQKPSPIQLHSIPMGKCGFDLLLEAKSGTGKTGVFSIIILEKLDLNKGLQAIILAPTREIAAQICDVIKQIGSFYEGLNVEVVMGGLSVQNDVNKFKNKVHIVVASPGRLRHLIQDKHVDVSAVRIIVLDEADKLMEKSFQPDIKYIFSTLPKQKQTIMSSATYSEQAKNFITNYVENAQHICPNTNCVLLGVDQKITIVKSSGNVVNITQCKFQELIKIFTTRQFKQCLIFCNYQTRVSELHNFLIANKWPAEELYGQQEQTIRLEALKTLQEYKCRILICTDLAARGIDASNVDLVINFDPPFEWQTYLHRIGRAGRYGSYGISVTILAKGQEEEKFKKMITLMKNSIILKDLWSDKEITLTNELDKTQPQANEVPSIEKYQEYQKLKNKLKENKSKYEELWHILNEDHILSDNKIENFEELCASFDKDEEKMGSICNLLESFENGHDKNLQDNSDYKNIKIKQILDEDILIALRRLKKTDKEKSSNVHKGSENIEQRKNDSTSSNSEVYENNEQVENKLSIENAEDQPSCSIVSSKDQELDLDTKDAFLLDLPTAFSSSKNKRYNKGANTKKKTKNYHINNKISTPKDKNVVDEADIFENSGYINKEPKEPKDKGSFNSYKNSIDTKGEAFKKSVKHIDNNQSVSNINNLNLQTNKRLMEYNIKATWHNHHDNTNYVNDNYSKWYSQLKFRMKEVELSLYLAELSKM